MSKAYFDYEIRSASTNKRVSDGDFMMLVERNFISRLKRFEYSLVLVIKRNKLGDKYLTPVDSEKDPFKYLHIYHNYTEEGKIPWKFKMVSEEKEEGVYRASYNLSPAENNELSEHLYIKYVFEIPESAISGLGCFGFSHAIDEEPSIDHRFNYYTEFKEKVYYFYSLKKVGNSLRITLPPFRNVTKEFHLQIAASSEYPHKVNNLLDEKSEILVPKGGSRTTHTIGVNLGQGLSEFKHFRLVIKEKEMANFFVLVNKDERDSFKHDKIYYENRTDEHKLCPFCARPIVFNSHARYQYCDGTPLDVSSNAVIKLGANEVYKNAIFCNRYLLNENNNALLIPPATYNKDKKTTFISILGKPSSGKSVFLSTLFGLQNGKKSNNLSYFGRFTSLYHLSFDLSEITYLDKRNLKNKNIQLLKTSSQTMGVKGDEDYYEDFKINASTNGEFLKTGTNVRFYPFILTTKNKSSSLILKDIAGEDAEKENLDIDNDVQGKTVRIENSDAFLVFIAPDDKDFKDTVNRVIKHAKNKPVAFVLTKFDKLMNDPEYDINNACLNDATYDMVDKSSYSGSTLEKNIEQASCEVKEIMKEKVREFPMQQVENSCKNAKFFAISSLGNEKCIFGNNNIGFYTTPHRVELPLIWLLFQTGIIG